jgi:hypothetical protein
MRDNMKSDECRVERSEETPCASYTPFLSSASLIADTRSSCDTSSSLSIVGCEHRVGKWLRVRGTAKYQDLETAVPRAQRS